MDTAAPAQLTGTKIPPRKWLKPKSLTVLFHGYDSNGGVISDMRVAFEKHLPGNYIFAPDAPRPVSESEFRWFDVVDATVDEIYNAVQSAAELVNDTVDKYLDALGLDEAHTAFIGYSQGACVALHAALTRSRRIAGVLTYSGQIAGPSRLADEIVSRPKVCIVHGRDDQVTPVDAVPTEISFLMSHNIPVTSHICDGVKHAINKEGLIHGARFLVDVLNKPA